MCQHIPEPTRPPRCRRARPRYGRNGIGVPPPDGPSGTRRDDACSECGKGVRLRAREAVGFTVARRRHRIGDQWIDLGSLMGARVHTLPSAPDGDENPAFTGPAVGSAVDDNRSPAVIDENVLHANCPDRVASAIERLQQVDQRQRERHRYAGCEGSELVKGVREGRTAEDVVPEFGSTVRISSDGGDRRKMRRNDPRTPENPFSTLTPRSARVIRRGRGRHGRATRGRPDSAARDMRLCPARSPLFACLRHRITVAAVHVVRLVGMRAPVAPPLECAVVEERRSVQAPGPPRGSYPVRMARTTSDSAEKEPGRLKQMYQVFKMTRRINPKSIWWFIAAFGLPVIAGIVLAFVIPGQTIIGSIIWVVLGVLAGVLLFLIALGRLAERAAYSQIEGQPGAVGSVLAQSLRRNWRASEMPVAMHGRSQSAVYRAVGLPGVVLITEGQRGTLTRLLEEEKRKVHRIVPNVALTVLEVGTETGQIPLPKLARRMNRLKRSLNRNEVLAVANRLDSMTHSPAAAVPKGIDPMRVRAGRPR